MGKAVLISGDPKTQQAIKPLLPKQFMLEEFGSLDELPQPSPLSSAQGPYSDSVLLVDWTAETAALARLEPFRRAGIPLIALIDSPARREAAFRAGFDDYLLRPFSRDEINLRLDRFTRKAPQVPSPDKERQAAVGRLTSYFCHAVNNSMQAIRGAIDLAREERGLTPGVAEYLTICRRETEIIGAKINRLRQIYRSQPSVPEAVRLDGLLRETLQMAADDLLRNNVIVKEQLDPLPAIHCSPDRVSLALLMAVFHLSGGLGGRGGGELLAQAGRDRGDVQVTLTASPGPEAERRGDKLPPDLEPASELICSERGRLLLLAAEGGERLQIRFPAGGS
jgi:CheY-like chemotaxis protein